MEAAKKDVMQPAKKDLLQLENKWRPHPLESLLKPENENKTGKEGLKTTNIPESKVFDRVKDFLPLMEEANRKLNNDIVGNKSDDHSIEALRGDEDRVIEMDLLLGITDLKTPEALAAAEAAVAGHTQALDADCNSEDDTEEDTNSDNDDDSEDDTDSDSQVASEDNSLGDESDENVENHETSESPKMGKRKRDANTKTQIPRIEVL